MADKPCTDSLAKERRQAWCDLVHLFREVGNERLAIVGERHDPRCECRNVQHVDFGKGRSHRPSRGVEDVLCEGGVITDEGRELRELLLIQRLLVSNKLRDAGVQVVIGHETDELREMIPVPLAYPHGEEIDVLVKLVKERDGLDDHVIDPVNVEF